jgi:DNA-binding transcriptional regulator YdaS (Cro superfamily)
MNPELRLHTLQRAVQIAGGMETLAARLGTDWKSVSQWAGGEAPMPERVFLEAVDLVLEDDVARSAQDRRRSPRA